MFYYCIPNCYSLPTHDPTRSILWFKRWLLGCLFHQLRESRHSVTSLSCSFIENLLANISFVRIPITVILRYCSIILFAFVMTKFRIINSVLGINHNNSTSLLIIKTSSVLRFRLPFIFHWWWQPGRFCCGLFQ